MKTWERYKTDPQYRERIAKRAKIVEAIRDFFSSEGFVEVETPQLVRAPGMEPNLAHFKTTLRAAPGASAPSEIEGFLITSPEYACKKMLAAGIPKLFSLGKVFRNGEPWGGAHNPEFTMLEWYRAGEEYRKLMDDTERLVAACARVVGHPGYPAWERLSVREAFARAQVNLDECLTRDTMSAAARRKGYAVSSDDTFDDCFFKIFLTEIEPGLGTERPTILYEYPVQMAALSRPKPEDPRYAERFEVYLGGLELSNAFSELTDPVEQRRRLVEEQNLRVRLGKERLPVDEDFLAALAHMPPSAGNALGVDRLVMALTGAASIPDVMLFPASDLFQE